MSARSDRIAAEIGERAARRARDRIAAAIDLPGVTVATSARGVELRGCRLGDRARRELALRALLGLPR